MNPVDGVELPAVRGVRDRVAAPAEAAALLAVLDRADRVVWATAMYAGLRLGELQALHAEDVDPERGIINVRRGWDQYAGEQATKSRAGERRVPVVAVLRPDLFWALEARPQGLVFGRTDSVPFSPATLHQRARRRWAENAKALQTFMGHASITITLDRYGHLFPELDEAIAQEFDRQLVEAQRRRANTVVHVEF
jgi:integrase